MHPEKTFLKNGYIQRKLWFLQNGCFQSLPFTKFRKRIILFFKVSLHVIKVSLLMWFSLSLITSQSKLSLNSEANAADQWKDPFLVCDGKRSRRRAFFLLLEVFSLEIWTENCIYFFTLPCVHLMHTETSRKWEKIKPTSFPTYFWEKAPFFPVHPSLPLEICPQLETIPEKALKILKSLLPRPCLLEIPLPDCPKPEQLSNALKRQTVSRSKKSSGNYLRLDFPDKGNSFCAFGRRRIHIRGKKRL